MELKPYCFDIEFELLRDQKIKDIQKSNTIQNLEDIVVAAMRQSVTEYEQQILARICNENITTDEKVDKFSKAVVCSFDCAQERVHTYR